MKGATPNTLVLYLLLNNPQATLMKLMKLDMLAWLYVVCCAASKNLHVLSVKCRKSWG